MLTILVYFRFDAQFGMVTYSAEKQRQKVYIIYDMNAVQFEAYENKWSKIEVHRNFCCF